MKNKSIFERFLEVFIEKGIFYSLKLSIKLSIDFIKYIFFILLKHPDSFVFNGKKYKYFHHPLSWNSERVIEIPLILEMMNKHKGLKILEVGNVLSNFTKLKKDTLDKYEKSESVINEDVVSFKPEKKYNLIVSISTLEHVGWDEKPKEPTKVIKALKNLKKCLSKDGQIMLTLPVGYNTTMDKLIKENKIIFKEKYYFIRISKNNRWKQVNFDDVKNIKYSQRFPHANAILFGIINKK